jgi:hypothetical protein
MTARDTSVKDVVVSEVDLDDREDAAADGVAGPPLLERKSVLMGLLTSGFVAANVVQSSSAVAVTVKPTPIAATLSAYVARWTPSTAYTFGQQLISPNNDVATANVAHTSSSSFSADIAKWTLSSTYARQEVFVNVLAAGVKGDGVTDDTAAINAAITANPGKVLLFPAGRTYQIVQWADNDSGGGIKLNKPGTTLWLYGAKLRLQNNAYPHYQMINVTAADCKVIGGTLIGDAVGHTGSAGEWGYGISVGAGGHRFIAENVYATLCWGDGFFIWERPADVCFSNCVGDNNRRQGLSIIDAIRPRVTGGAYINNGKTKFTGPGGGIDLEPDSGSTRDVLDAVVTGVTLTGNKGPGFWSSSNGRTITATVTGCRSIGNGWTGFLVDGVNNLTTLNSCESNGNAWDGFSIGTNVGRPVGTKINSCVAQGNAGFGITDYGIGTVVTGGSVENNGQSGLDLHGSGSIVIGTSANGNCKANMNNVQVDIYSTNAALNGVKSVAGDNSVKPNYGFAVRSTATGARLIGCDASGAFTGGTFTDQTAGASAVTMPFPGVARAAAIAAPTAPATTYSQASAASMKTAVDAIRIALQNHGITA